MSSGGPPGTQAPSLRAWGIGLVGLAFVVLFVFSSSLRNGFLNWDDDLYITENRHLQPLSTENLTWMFQNRNPQWGPLALIAHALDVRWFGLDPAGHHLTSALLHAVNAILVALLFAAVARAARAPWSAEALLTGALAAGLLFAVHPLRVESVAWASEKKDLLCALSFLAAVLLWIRGARATGRRRVLMLAAIHACGVLALLTKPMAVTLPVALLLVDAFPLGRLSRSSLPRLVKEKLLLFAAAVAVAVVAITPRSDAPRVSKGDLTKQEDILVAIRAATFYVEKTLWPTRLVPFYPLPPPKERGASHPRYLLSGLVLALATGLAIAAARRGWPAALAAWAWYLVTLLPASGIVQLSGQMASDRFSYLPTVSGFLLIGASVAWAFGAGRGPRIAALALVLAAGFALSLGTGRQLRIWRDSETFWSYVAEAFPGRVVMAHNNLGAIYLQRALRTGDPVELAFAEAQYREALRIFPEHANAWNNLGIVHEQRGNRPEAVRCYERALALAPGHRQASENLERLGRHRD